MFERHLISRTLQIGLCGATILLCATPGNGEPAKASKADKRACSAAFKSGKERQDAGRLREARELLTSCKKATCGKAVRQECTVRLNQLKSDIPSIVPVVTDESGAARVDVQVTMDGELLTTRLDGQALVVDPGVHEFSFSTTDKGVFATQKVMIVQGQHNRTISASMQSARKRTVAAATTPSEAKSSAEPTADEAPRRLMSEQASAREGAPEAESLQIESKGGGPGPLPYVIGGAGAAAIGLGALMIVWGNKDNDQLNNCQPNCSQASVDHIKSLYTTADISIGVGVAALGVATYMFVTGSTKEKPPSRGYAFDVQPTPSGAFASASGAF